MISGAFRSKTGFTVVNNNIAKDKTISLKTKGLYLLIQSYITMPDKIWYKKDFFNLASEGRKAFDSAWNELKERGYLKVHRTISGNNFNIEYELLEEPVLGPHTFTYNAKGEITKTNQYVEDIDNNVNDTLDDTSNDADDTISTNAPKRDSRKDSTFFTSVPKGNTPKRNIPEGNFPKRNAPEGDTILNNNDSNTIDLITKDINTHSINTDKTYWSDVTDELKDEYIGKLRKNIAYESTKQRESESAFEMYDKLYSILEAFIKNPPTTRCVRIANIDIPYDEAVDKFMKLRYEHINCAREKLKNTDLSKITSFSKYALTIIYNVAEMPEAFLKDTKKEKSSFNQMKKRNYNIDELLKAARVN